MCLRGDKHFDVHFWWISPVHFLSKHGENAVYERRNGWKGVYFPLESDPKDGNAEEQVERWQPFQEKHKRNILGTSIPKINEESIMFRKRLKADSTENSQELGRTISRILGALSKIDEYLNPTVTDILRKRSGNIPEHGRGKRGANWGLFSE